MDDNRGMIEALVISSFLQDLTLIHEYPVTENHFETNKCKFFFEIAKHLSNDYKEVNQINVETFVGQSKILSKSFEDYGGWASVEKAKSLANLSEFDKNIDNLYKVNLINDLKEKGFNIKKKITIEGEEVTPCEIFPLMSSEEVFNFYEMLLTNASVNTTSNLVAEDLYFTDEEIEQIESGEDDSSISYDITMRWTDENGKERYKRNLSMLNNITDGICSDNGIFLLGSASGGGKSTTSFQMALGMVESNEKVIFISNEQRSRYFKQMLISFVASTVFNCYTLDRRKIKHMEFTPEEKVIFTKVNKFVKEKYTGKLKFVSVTEFNVSKILKFVKKMKLSEGYGGCVIETFKSSEANGDAVNELVENSRIIDKFAKQYGVKMVIPMQLKTSSDGKVSLLTNAEISSSKQVVEVCGSIVLFRKIIRDELDKKNNKLFLKPYKWVMDDEGGKYKKKYLDVIDSKSDNEEDKPKKGGRLSRDKVDKGTFHEYLDINKQYRLAIVTKAREGSDNNKFVILELNGAFGEMKEICYADNCYSGQLSY